MAEMSAGLANCFCGQPPVKPPLNPSAGQFAGFAGTAARCAKLTGSLNTVAANAAAIPNAFSFMITCSPGIVAWIEKRNYISCIRPGVPAARCRASLWEVHPIYKFEVCPNGTCADGGWKTLEDWVKPATNSKAANWPPGVWCPPYSGWQVLGWSTPAATPDGSPSARQAAACEGTQGLRSVDKPSRRSRRRESRLQVRA